MQQKAASIKAELAHVPAAEASFRDDLASLQMSNAGVQVLLEDVRKGVSVEKSGAVLHEMAEIRDSMIDAVDKFASKGGDAFSAAIEQLKNEQAMKEARQQDKQRQADEVRNNVAAAVSRVTKARSVLQALEARQQATVERTTALASSAREQYAAYKAQEGELAPLKAAASEAAAKLAKARAEVEVAQKQRNSVRARREALQSRLAALTGRPAPMSHATATGGSAASSGGRR